MKLRNQKHAAFYDAVCEAARHCGLRAEPYSGRGMYGEHCVSVEYDDSKQLLELGMRLAAEGLRPSQIPDTAGDSMGLGAVIYWPAVLVEEEATDLDADYEED